MSHIDLLPGAKALCCVTAGSGARGWIGVSGYAVPSRLTSVDERNLLGGTPYDC